MKSLILAFVIWSGAAHADLIQLATGSQNKESVNISSGAHVTLNGSEYDLTTVGSGLRKKKVVLVPIKVYIAQLMVDAPSVYEKTDAGALPSLDKQTSVAMHLTFLRDVPADNIKESFQSSLDANGVPANDPDIVKFMAMVDEVGAAETGSALTIFVTKRADGEVVALENKKSSSTLRTMTGAPGLGRKLMSIWLGVPADDYLAELKAELLQ